MHMDDGAPFELPSVDDLEVAAAAAAAALEVLAPTQETSSEEEDSSSDEEVGAMQAQSQDCFCLQLFPCGAQLAGFKVVVLLCLWHQDDYPSAHISITSTINTLMDGRRMKMTVMILMMRIPTWLMLEQGSSRHQLTPHSSL
jgi:hypothetical protein